MTQSFTRGFGFLLATLFALSAMGTSSAASELDFELINKTGYAIKEIYLAPSTQEEWEPSDKNVLPRVLQDGETVSISFNPIADAPKWDLKIVWEDGGDSVEWLGFNLTEISKLSLHYNDKTEKTTADIE